MTDSANKPGHVGHSWLPSTHTAPLSQQLVIKQRRGANTSRIVEQ